MGTGIERKRFLLEPHLEDQVGISKAESRERVYGPMEVLAGISKTGGPLEGGSFQK